MFLHFLLGICSEYKTKTLPLQTKETKNKTKEQWQRKKLDVTELI